MDTDGFFFSFFFLYYSKYGDIRGSRQSPNIAKEGSVIYIVHHHKLSSKIHTDIT